MKNYLIILKKKFLVFFNKSTCLDYKFKTKFSLINNQFFYKKKQTLCNCKKKDFLNGKQFNKTFKEIQINYQLGNTKKKTEFSWMKRTGYHWLGAYSGMDRYLCNLKIIPNAYQISILTQVSQKGRNIMKQSVIEKNNNFFNQCFDKGRLKSLVIWFLKNYGEYKTVQLVEELKNVGFYYASKAGISLGVDDLKVPPRKATLILEAEKLTTNTITQYKRGEITGVERFQCLIDTWHRTSEILKQEVIDNFEATDVLNPVYMMAFSGARGNISQVRQLVGMRGLMADPQGQILDFPIRSNFREGLTLTEYIISSYGARKGIVDTALRTANAGYLTRRLVDVAQHVIISTFDCETKRGIFLTNMKEGNKTIHSLSQRILGRVLGRDIYVDNKPDKIKLASRNDEITTDLAFNLSQNFEKIFVRSSLTCEKTICQLCYGWSLAQGKLVSIGEAVGVVAAQSIGEPGTQLTMRTFHTGGVFAGDISEQIKAPYDGIIEYMTAIPGVLIRTPEGKIAFLTKGEGSFIVHKMSFSNEKTTENYEKKQYKIPPYSLLYMRNGQNVIAKQVLAQITSISQKTNATDYAELTIKSDIEGQLYAKSLILQEKKIGPKKKETKNYNVDNLEFDKIYEAWTWGYAWILSGKIYEFKETSPLFPVIGDLLDKKSIITQIKWSLNNTKFLAHITDQDYLVNMDKNKIKIDYLKRTPLELDINFSKQINKNKVVSHQEIGFDSKDFFNNTKTLTKYPLKVSEVFVFDSYNFLFKKYGYTCKIADKNTFFLYDTQQRLNNKIIHQKSSSSQKSYFDLLFLLKYPFKKNLNGFKTFKKLIKNEKLLEDFPYVLQWFPSQYNTKSSGTLVSEYPIIIQKRRHIYQKTNIIARCRKNNSNIYSFNNKRFCFLKTREIENFHMIWIPSFAFKFSMIQTLCYGLNVGLARELGQGWDQVWGQEFIGSPYFWRTPTYSYILNDQTNQFNLFMSLFLKKKIKFLQTNRQGSQELASKKFPNNFKKGLVIQSKTKMGFYKKYEFVTKQSMSVSNMFLNVKKINILKSNFLKDKSYFKNTPIFGDSIKCSNTNKGLVLLIDKITRTKNKGFLNSLNKENLNQFFYSSIKNFKSFCKLNLLLTDFNFFDKKLKQITNLQKFFFILQKLKLFMNTKKNFNKYQNINSLHLFSKIDKFLNQNRSLLLLKTAFFIYPNLNFKLSKFLEKHFINFSSIKDKRNFHTFLSEPPNDSIGVIILSSNIAKPLGLFGFDWLSPSKSTPYQINGVNFEKNNNIKDIKSYNFFAFKAKTNNTFVFNYLNQKSNSIMLNNSKISTNFQLNSTQYINTDLNSINNSFFKNIRKKNSYSSFFHANLRKGWVYVPTFSFHGIESHSIAKDSSRIEGVEVAKSTPTPQKTLGFCFSNVYEKTIIYPGQLFLNNLNFNIPVFVDPFLILFLFNIRNIRSFKLNKNNETLISAMSKIKNDQNNRKKESDLKKDLITNLDKHKNFNKIRWIKNNKTRYYFEKEFFDFNSFNEKKFNNEKNKIVNLENILNCFLIQPAQEFNKKMNFDIKKYVYNFIPTTVCTKFITKIKPFIYKKDNYLRYLYVNKSFDSLSIKSNYHLRGSFFNKDFILSKDLILRKYLDNLSTNINSFVFLTNKDIHNKLLLYCNLSDSNKNLIDWNKIGFIQNKVYFSKSSSLKPRKPADDFYILSNFLFKKNIGYSFKQKKTIFSFKHLELTKKICTTQKNIVLLSLVSRKNLNLGSFFIYFKKYEYFPIIYNTNASLTFSYSPILSLNSSFKTAFSKQILNFLNFYLVDKKDTNYFNKIIKENITDSLINRVSYFVKNLFEVPCIDFSFFKKFKAITKKFDYEQKTFYSYSNTSFYFHSNKILRKNNPSMFFLKKFGQHYCTSSPTLLYSDAHTYYYSPFDGELVYVKNRNFLQNNFKNLKNVSVLFDNKRNFNYQGISLSEYWKKRLQEYRISMPTLNNSCMFLTKENLISYFLPKLNNNNKKKLRDYTSFIKKNEYKIQDTIIKFVNMVEIQSLFNSNYNFVLNQIKPKFTITISKTTGGHPITRASIFRKTNHNNLLTNHFNSYKKNNNIRNGFSLLGDFYLYGDPVCSLDNKDAINVVQNSGQLIHYNNSKITIRKAQPIFISPKGILHKLDADFIDPKSPVITLSYQRLKTGDIIQGIPKVEQYFEARTTKRGRLFRDSLPSLLKALFKRYHLKLTPALAVRQSFYKIQQIIVDGVHRVYKSQGVTISDKHLEVIVKQMTSKVRILDGAQTGFFPGEIVDISFVEKINIFLIKKITYEPLVLGITKASLEVDSFLSAASFQQTTKVLSQSSIYKKKDFLKGLKENVILGNLIPAGTGYLVSIEDLI